MNICNLACIHQVVDEIYDEAAAATMGITDKGQVGRPFRHLYAARGSLHEAVGRADAC